MIKSPKKLIEVALPLKVINEACAREKSIRHGHPSTLHLWWARRPLAAARAVLFAQMVNDPGGERGYKSGLTKEQAQAKRDELFHIIGDLVQWENTNNESVLRRAREKIMESWRETCRLNAGQPGFNPDVLPACHDPFAGGGAIPLEAQRLGLESYASDLNPVAVMINKAMIEIPPKFAGRVPIGPLPEGEDFQPPLDGKWPGAKGLAEDVRRYGHWMREEAKKRIGHLYPQVEITAEMAAERPDLKPLVGQKLTVIAWLWARTVKSPNPAFSHVDVPLVSSFVLSKKKGKEAWVEPVVDGDGYHFKVHDGIPPQNCERGTKGVGTGTNFRCILSETPISSDYIHDSGWQGEIGSRLMAIVCEGPRGRVYVDPLPEHERLAFSAVPGWRPSGNVPPRLTGGTCRYYGYDTWDKIFTNRQLVILSTLSESIQTCREKIISDCKAQQTGEGAEFQNESVIEEYADAVLIYLAFAVDKMADLNNSLCRWEPVAQCPRQAFGRQALPVIWDYAEANALSESSGSWINSVDGISRALGKCFVGSENIPAGYVAQNDAQTQTISANKVVSTDPPYYDNIAYADFSDFFYVWLRHSLGNKFANLFSTMESPKQDELVAIAKRHGGRDKAEQFFMNGMTTVMRNLADMAHTTFPISIYYAFRQSSTDTSGTSNAGWESFLEAVICAGFSLIRTWPMRTENESRLIGHGANALASSIVLVCRKRGENAVEISKREFLKELKDQMPEALRAMQGLDGLATPVAPVDMAQAAIGPGMEIYSKYKAVLNADGSRMSVHDAIIEINRYLDKGDDFDPETQFCRDWFMEHAWGSGASGDAIILAQSKGLSVNDVVDAGILVSHGGKTGLLQWQDYPEDYDPTKDTHRPVWEVCHHLVRIHQRHGTGEAGAFLSQVPAQGEAARQLAYVLYTICERKGLADDARVYNELATGWSDILTASIENARPTMSQAELDL